MASGSVARFFRGKSPSSIPNGPGASETVGLSVGYSMVYPISHFVSVNRTPSLPDRFIHQRIKGARDSGSRRGRSVVKSEAAV